MMSDSFDPYKNWLSISPDERPIDHYLLLGIERFTDDVDAIKSAADQRMAHVKSFQHGPHSDDSQNLLNEIAKAQICLLDESKKTEYDADLQNLLDELKPPKPIIVKPPVQQPPKSVKPVAAVPLEKKSKPQANDEVSVSPFPWKLVATVGTGASAASIAMFVFFTIFFSRQLDELKLVSVTPAANSTSTSITATSLEDTIATGDGTEVSEVNGVSETPEPEAITCPDQNTRTEESEESKSAPQNKNRDPVNLTPEVTSKTVVPAVSPSANSKPQQTVAVKQESKNSVSPTEDIRKLIEEKIVADADASQYISVLQLIETRTDEALNANDFVVANSLADLAESTMKKTRNRLLVRRVKSLQSRVHDLEKEFAKVKVAQATLAESPNDGPAHTLIGKYLCLVQSDWDKGLPHLAKGSHSGLKVLAGFELQNPATAEDQSQLGDAWWDAAARAGFRERQLYRQRAVFWYESAMPELSDMQREQLSQRVLEHEIVEADGWHVVFKSTNPEHWNSDFVDGDDFAVPLSEVGVGVQFLRIERKDIDEQVIIPMNRRVLEAGGVISPLVMWKTPTSSSCGVPLLGVANSALVVSPTQPWLEINEDDGVAYAGWGFGAVSSGGSTQMQTWQGTAVSDVEFEISVKYAALSKDERAFLLR